MTELDAVLPVEAVGRVCPDTTEFLYNQQLAAPLSVELFGTEDAKKHYLPPVLDAEDSIAIDISELEAGSDVGAMRTRIEKHGDDLVLDDEKTWVEQRRAIECDARLNAVFRRIRIGRRRVQLEGRRTGGKRRYERP